MRQIKFRAKRIDNGEWVYGHYFQVDENHTIVTKDGVYRFIDESTLGQFIDRRDKNGVEIYFGDLITVDGVDDGKSVHEIKWEDDLAQIELPRYGDGSLYNSGGYEVIGNVTDNKELLS